MKKNKVHIIPHSHWDREWYFTNDESNHLLYFQVKHLVETLEKNKDIKHYNFDAQMALVEDFQKYNPVLFERFKKLVSEGRITVGPLYTQPDTRIPLAETILRNFDYGKSSVIKPNTNVVYLPDTFGHNQDMPTILAHAGYENVIVWRGTDVSKIKDGVHFRWKSDWTDNKVNGVFLKNGYTCYGLGYSEGTNIEYDFKTKPMIENYLKTTKGNTVAIPEGSDQLPINENAAKLIKKLNSHNDFIFEISTWQKYFESIDFMKMNEISGSFEVGSITRAHKTITSTRNDIKKLFFELENYLINIAEPTLFILHKDGIDYPKEIINNIWKDILTTSAHDSMGMCNTDAVNKEIKDRLIRASRNAHNLVDASIKLFVERYATKNKCDENEILVVINPTSDTEIFISDTITSSGSDFTILHNEKKINFIKNNSFENQGDLKLVWDKELGEKVETKPNFFTTNISFNLTVEPYSINILNINNSEIKGKVTSQSSVKKAVSDFVKNIRFDVISDKGDSYDFAPITEDEKPTLLSPRNIKLISSSVISDLSKYNYEFDLELPTNPHIDNATHLIKFAMEIWHDDKIKFNLSCVNMSSNIRLRMLFKKDGDVFIGKQLSESKFEKISKPKEWTKSFKDMPIDIEVFQNYLFDNSKQITTSSSREMSIEKFGSNTYIAITLFRSISQFGRKGISWRPGRASGRELPTPDALLHDTLSWSMLISDKKENLADRVNMINKLMMIPVYQNQKENLDYRRLSRFDIKQAQSKYKSNFNFKIPSGLVIQSIRYSGNGYILRLRNTTNSSITFGNKSIKKFNICEFKI